MKYTLMHRNIAVIDFEVDDKENISKVYNIYNLTHLPVGINMTGKYVNRTQLNDWWKNRSIPASRDGLAKLLKEIRISSTVELIGKSYGLSLSDQYWIKPDNKDLKWEDINFFNNEFSEDIGNIIMGVNVKKTNIDLMSPDNTSDGNLKKRWKIINGKRYLLKSGTGLLQQEVFNEVLASKIMKLLNIPHIEYDVLWIGNTPYSICEDFIKDDEELVPAWRLFLSKKKNNNADEYNHMLNLAKDNEIPNYIESIDKMLVLDYLIANEDRHYNNFGFIRDAITLKYKKVAPIYDNGCSLGYNSMSFSKNFNPDWKPFMHGKITSQLELVSTFDWLDISKLNNIDKMVNDIYPNKVEYKNRIKEISRLINYRIEKLKQFINQKVVDINSFGDYLKKLRKIKNISMQELANRLNITKSFLSLIENGKKLIPLDYADKITKIFDLNNQEKEILKSTIQYTNNRVEISLNNMNESQKKVSIEFAKQINDATPEMIEDLEKILSRNSKSN